MTDSKRGQKDHCHWKPASVTMKCMSCLSARSHADDSTTSKALNKKLKDWNKEEARVIKLLLLGTGESGKSTVTKQMKIIHVNGFSDCERSEKVADIRRNVKDSILTILGAMCNLNIELEDEGNKPSMEYIMSHTLADDFDYPQEFYEHTSRLWKDRGVQSCYHRSNEYQLIDSAKYFMDMLDTIRQPDYMPSDQDILRCRVMTNCIQQIDFAVKDHGTSVNFSVYDVGGQQGERRKWIQVFDSVTAILFVLDCSSFDTTLREDQTRNRLLEAAETLEQVWNSRWLRSISVMLFINKIDLLADKVNQGKSLNTLIDAMNPECLYYERFKQFEDFKLKDDEKHEFLKAYPKSEEGHPSPKANGHFFKRKRSEPVKAEVSDEVVKTAVFIKKMFMGLIQDPVMFNHTSKYHEHHTCEYFYTCAVDTDTIQKVLEGCRSVIIRKHLVRWSV